MHRESRTIVGFDQIKTAWNGLPNHQLETIQLSPGVARSDVQTLNFGDLRLIKSRLDARFRWKDTKSDGSTHLVFAARPSKSRSSIGGQTFTGSNLFCFSGPGAVTSISEPGFESVEIAIGENVLKARGISGRQKRFAAPRLEVLDQLHRVLSCAFRTSQDQTSLALRHRDLRSQILNIVDDVLGSRPDLDGLPNKKFKNFESIVASAEAIMDGWDFETNLDIDTLTDQLDVSRRTIHTAFQSCLGMGPIAFYRVKRLHWLQQDLSVAQSGNVSIASLAHSYGFFELGRLANYYRSHFGELPSHTLMRDPR